MMLYGHKGGSGTSSRQVDYEGETYTVGAFVQANFGLRSQLLIAGIPMAEHLSGPEPYGEDTGSIIAVVATDAPMVSHQLNRLARRVSLGVGRSGSISGHGSGDIFLAFSTAGAEDLDADTPYLKLTVIPDHRIDPFFEAVIQAVDEAIMNVLSVGEEMVGINGHTATALDREKVTAVLKRFGRYREPPGFCPPLPERPRT